MIVMLHLPDLFSLCSLICDQFYKVPASVCKECNKCDCYPDSSFCSVVSGEGADLGVSILTVMIFVIPIITSLLFNYPKRVIKSDSESK